MNFCSLNVMRYGCSGRSVDGEARWVCETPPELADGGAATPAVEYRLRSADPASCKRSADRPDTDNLHMRSAGAELIVCCRSLASR
jgi:hypothetical protein